MVRQISTPNGSRVAVISRDELETMTKNFILLMNGEHLSSDEYSKVVIGDEDLSHLVDDEGTCPDCGKTLEGLRSFVQHLNRTQDGHLDKPVDYLRNEEDQYECRLCETTFDAGVDLQRHINDDHDDIWSLSGMLATFDEDLSSSTRAFESMDVIEQSRYLAEREQDGEKQQDIAADIGRDDAWVSRHIAVWNEGTDELHEALREGDLPFYLSYKTLKNQVDEQEKRAKAETIIDIKDRLGRDARVEVPVEITVDGIHIDGTYRHQTDGPNSILVDKGYLDGSTLLIQDGGQMKSCPVNTGAYSDADYIRLGDIDLIDREQVTLYPRGR